MIAKLFSPTLFHRLFDPMPLPRALSRNSGGRAGNKVVDTGRSLVPKNRVALPSSLFYRRIKRIPTNS